MSTPLKVKEIKASKHQSTQFAKLSFFLLEKDHKRQKVYTSFKYKLHLVKSLKTNILIDNNILVPESFFFDIRWGHIVVRSFGVKITIRARQKHQFLNTKLFAKSNGMVSLCSEVMVLLYIIFFLDDRDFLYHLVA